MAEFKPHWTKVSAIFARILAKVPFSSPSFALVYKLDYAVAKASATAPPVVTPVSLAFSATTFFISAASACVKTIFFSL
jgi:hypothetical protein